MKKILLSSLGLFVGFLSFSQVPVVYYDFEVNASRSNSWEATVELAVNAGNSAFTRAGLGSFTQAAGAGSLYGGNMGRAIMGDRWPTSSTNPGALATEYFQFSANTEGLFGLSMVFDVAKSGTGPRAMGITYSLDGITFMPLTSLAISGGFSNTIVPLPVALENRSKVTFRLYGYNAQNGSGDLSIDNMQLSATGISGVKTLFDFDAYANSLSSGSPGAQKLTGDLSIMGVGTIITLNSSVNLSGLISVATGSTFRLGVDASLTGASKLDLADGSTLQISSTDQRSAIKGNIGNTILKTFPNAIIEFIGSTGQVQDAATLPNVVVNNPNGVTHTGEVVINGNLTLKNGTMKPGAYKVTVNGNIAKTGGAIDASNSELVFNGTTEQTVAADAFAGPVKRMNVNNPGGVAMNSDVTVSEALNLTKGRLKIGTKKLTIRGALSRDGIAETGDIDAQNGTVEFGGTAVQAVPPGSFQNNKCKGLRISNTHIDGVSLNGALDVTSVLDFGTVNNSKLKTNGNLTLKSDATGTALVGDLTNGGVNSGNDIIGDVIVERHTPAASSRRYRVVTSPVSGISINEAWQEGGKWNGSTANPANGFGTLITGQAQGTATKANSNGFDYWSAVAGGSASIRYYAATTNNSQAAWQPVASTLTPNAFDNNQAYLLFIRGDRSASTGTNAGTTTLRAKGNLKKGTFTVDVPTTKSHTLVGNPYASPLDFKAIYDANSTKIKPYFWVWKASLGTGTGGYVLVQPVAPGSSLYEAIPGDGSKSATNRLIHSGEGFFVMPATTGAVTNTITIQEKHKSTGNPTVSVFRQQNVEPAKLYVNLATGTDAEKTLLDGALAQFGDAFADGSGINVIKAANTTENLSIQSGSSDVIVSSRYVPQSGDTLKLRVWNTTVKDYSLALSTANFADLGLTAVLVDNYLKKETVLNPTMDATAYDFSVTTATASKDPARFAIVFRTLTQITLPLALTSLKAEEKSSTTVSVQWKVADENDMKAYQVEKSGDGKDFYSLTIVKANALAGEQSYQHLDSNPSPVNYYRIKLLGKTGEFKYSSVVKVQLQSKNQGISMYPNPVSGGTFNLQLMNKPKGAYMLNLFNLAGQSVLAKTINHNGGSATEIISLSDTVTPGNYKLEIRNEAGKKEVLNFSLLK